MKNYYTNDIKLKLDLISRIKPDAVKSYLLNPKDCKKNSSLLIQNNLYITEDKDYYRGEDDTAWVELQLTNVLTRKNFFLTVVEDDDHQMEYWLTYKKLLLSEIGITESEMNDYDIRSTIDFKVEGSTYTYVQEYKSYFRETLDSQEEISNMFEYQEPGGKSLVIEKTAGGVWSVHLSLEISPTDIEVLSL